MAGQNVLLIGATGMVGGLALRACLADPRVAAITTIGRRPTGIGHPKLREIVHPDLASYAGVEEALAGQDAAIFCLGAYTGTVPDAELKRITADYTVAFAAALHQESPGAAVAFLSGQGADRSQQSRFAFARYKGIAENALLSQGFPRVHVFRPGYIYPVEQRREPNFLYQLMRALYPVVRHLYPNIGIAADALARAMASAALTGTPSHPEPILENADIRRLAASL